MSLSLAELESITSDYFLLDNGKAVDIYFNDSFLFNYLFKQKKGLYKAITGGIYVRCPLKYDGAEGGFYTRGSTLSSDDKTALNTARFSIKHLYSNATIIRTDELENSGPQQEVDMVADRLDSAQKQIAKDASGSIYASAGGGTSQFEGLRALCNATTSNKYGDIAEDDLVSEDGTKPWTGRTSSTSTVMGLSVIRTARRTAKLRDGANGKPDLFVTTETLYDALESILQVSQRFTEGVKTAAAGFTGLVYQNCEIFPDDFCPSGYGFALNSAHIGFGVHVDGNLMRLPWANIPESAGDRTMKILLDAALICNNRKGHYSYSALTT